MKLRTVNNSNPAKRRIVLGVVAVALTLTLIGAGTLAWRSLNQTARNDKAGTANPGGRLHDDYDGENKDVYVENFGTVDIFARIRLDEYMEIGTGAGILGDPIANQATPFNPGADINDVTTWTTHTPDTNPEECDNETVLKYHDYIEWDMGGDKIYMPTFDKNNESLKTDIAGLARDPDHGGANLTGADGSHNYWELNDKYTANALYSGGTSVSEEHTAKSTLTATVITMAQWVTLGKPMGAFWVYDTDGWAYWAEAIKPGTSTGLLLNSLRVVRDPDDDWYYGINVVAQFASRGDWNDGVNGEALSGFYDPANGSPVTVGSNAEYLLKQAAGLFPVVTGITVTPNPAPDFVIGTTGSMTFNAIVAGTLLPNGHGNEAVTWTITDGHGGTFADGVLTGAVNPGTYTVKAISKDDPTWTASVTVTVAAPTP